MNDLDEKRLISPRAADLIIGLRDGDAALLYLYLCRRGMEDRDHIAHELYLPKQRLSEAIERLEMLGLLPLTEQTPVSAENTASPRRLPETHLPCRNVLIFRTIPQRMSGHAKRMTARSPR